MSETRSVESTGADIEEAIEAGLKQLDVSRESVIVEILEEPSRGLLGLGNKEALVRLTTAARPRSEMSRPKTEGDGIITMPKSSVLPKDEWDDEVETGKVALEELLRLMDMHNVSVVPETNDGMDEDSDTIVLQVHGDDLSQLIGRKGDTLNALQYITRLIASRDLQRRANFVVDVGEYKAERANKLYRLANRMANQAIERNKVVKMEPMPPHERRIIHVALKNRGDVTTHSEGEGRYRKVTIIPRKD